MLKVDFYRFSDKFKDRIAPKLYYLTVGTAARKGMSSRSVQYDHLRHLAVIDAEPLKASTTKLTADIGASELARCGSPINAIISLTRDVPADSTATNSTLDNEDVEILDDPFPTETSPTSPTTKIVQLAAGDIDTEMADPTGTSSKSTMNGESIRLGSLNVRGLIIMLSQPSSPKHSLFRHLQSFTPPLSLLALWETHALSEHKASFDTFFQAQSSLWTKHYGLVSFNPLLLLNLTSVSDK
ncbi:hypothetical protein CLU79DRAFT_891954 [Phycomyces nitens]|nr:hypothetical protein CLU79DRAFT_891954 [Phycomyces nitens]